MYSAIFSIVFLMAAAVAILIGVLKGIKKVWQLSLIRIIMTFASAMLAAFASVMVSWFGLRAIVDALVNGGVLGSFSELLRELPGTKTAVLAILSMIITPMFFLLFYAIFRPVTSAFTKTIARAISKKPSEKSEEQPDDKNAVLRLEKAHPLSAALGGLGGLLTLCVLLIPLSGTLGVVNDISSLALRNVGESTGVEAASMGADILDGAANNAGTVTVKLMGGGLVYDMMTSYPMEGGFVTLKKESGFVKNVADAAVSISDQNVTTEKLVASLNKISDSFDNSTLMPIMVSEVVGAAADDWKDGNSYHGIACPKLGNPQLDPLVVSVMDGLSHSDRETIKVDVRTIVDIMATLAEDGAMGKLSTDPMAILGQEETTSEILLSLFQNERLYVVVDGVSDFGITMFMDTVQTHPTRSGLYAELLGKIDNVSGEDPIALTAAYADLFDYYGLRVDDTVAAAAASAKLAGEDMRAWAEANLAADEESYILKTELISTDMITEGSSTITDIEKESKALAHAYAVLYGMMGEMNGSSFDTKTMISKMGPALDSFKVTETIGPERTKYILSGMLQSEMVHDKIGFSVLEATDSAASIAKGSDTKGYDKMMVSLSLVVDVVESASDTNKDTTAAVDAMLDDLTPESAEVIQTLSKPSVMQNYGVSEKSSVPVSEMVSDTFGNLSDAKENGMSDEEYDRESKAVASMMNVLMSAGTTTESGTFGEGSNTNQSATEYVSNVLGSKVMSQTVVETVYGEGDTPKMDPLLSERVLSTEENTEFMTAINNQWTNGEKTEQDKREIIALAALMNTQVELDGEAWVIVPTAPIAPEA